VQRYRFLPMKTAARQRPTGLGTGQGTWGTSDLQLTKLTTVPSPVQKRREVPVLPASLETFVQAIELLAEQRQPYEVRLIGVGEGDTSLGNILWPVFQPMIRLRGKESPGPRSRERSEPDGRRVTARSGGDDSRWLTSSPTSAVSSKGSLSVSPRSVGKRSSVGLGQGAVVADRLGNGGESYRALPHLALPYEKIIPEAHQVRLQVARESTPFTSTETSNFVTRWACSRSTSVSREEDRDALFFWGKITPIHR
jgi:hypothetical protein